QQAKCGPGQNVCRHGATPSEVSPDGPDGKSFRAAYGLVQDVCRIAPRGPRTARRRRDGVFRWPDPEGTCREVVWEFLEESGWEAGYPSGRPPASSSGQDRGQDVAGHVGQAEVAAGVAVGQARVVDANQVQDGGVVVVDVRRVLHDPGAVL